MGSGSSKDEVVNTVIKTISNFIDDTKVTTSADIDATSTLSLSGNVGTYIDGVRNVLDVKGQLSALQDLRESDIDKTSLYSQISHQIKRENSGELVNVDVSKVNDTVTKTINESKTISKVIDAKVHLLTTLQTNIDNNVGGTIRNISNSALVRSLNQTTTNTLRDAVDDFADANGITSTDESKTSGLGDNVERTVGKVADDVADTVQSIGGDLIAIIMAPIIFIVICIIAGVVSEEQKKSQAAAAPAATPPVNFALVEAT